MRIKTTGAEFKKFYGDDDIWGGDIWHEDTVIQVNGQEVDSEYDLSAIPDQDKVVIISGDMYAPGNNSRINTINAAFSAWRKVQNTRYFSVEVDKENVEAFIEALKKLPGVKDFNFQTD